MAEDQWAELKKKCRSLCQEAEEEGYWPAEIWLSEEDTKRLMEAAGEDAKVLHQIYDPWNRPVAYRDIPIVWGSTETVAIRKSYYGTVFVVSDWRR